MKRFLYFVFIEQFTGGVWFEYIIGVFMWIFTIGYISLTSWLFLWLADSSFLPVRNGNGTISDKCYIADHSFTTNDTCKQCLHRYVMSGKLLMPINTYHNESYKIEIEIKGLKGEVYVSSHYFDSVEIGQKLCCTYTMGRILNTIYIKSLCNN